MRFRAAVLSGLALATFCCGFSAFGQSNPALNQPDRVAWQLFTQVNRYAATPGNNNALFETWASDPETFNKTPRWPSQTGGPTEKRLVNSVLRRGIHAVRPGLRAVPPSPNCTPTAQDPCIGEETVRNRAAFDYIVQNNLYTQQGLANAFGTTISFPLAAIEVKANWIPVSNLQAWNGVTPDQAPSLYHLNAVQVNGKPMTMALVAMHIISKRVPNWTWATFEHWKNPGRCDLIGCSDDFGAVQTPVAANATVNQGYPNCTHTAVLQQMFSAAGLADVWQNYCLKGKQTNFITSEGATILLGNSVIEGLNAGVPVNQSSCITCHSTAAYDKSGATLQQGLANNEVGAPNPAWFAGTGTGENPQYRQSDFVWAIPLCAVQTNGTEPCVPASAAVTK